MEDHTKLKSVLGKIEKERAKINPIHLSIQATLKINVLNLTIKIKMRASDVDKSITGF